MPIYRSTRDIKKNKLFSGIKESKLYSFFDQKDLKDAREGEIIYKKGDESNALFLIIKGEVKVKFSANNYVSNKIHNDFFGEKEILDETNRISTALAFTNIIYYRISKTILNNLLSKNPSIEENIKKFGELNIPDAPADLKRKSDIFNRDKPVSFKAFQVGNSWEENKKKENEPPSVMTQNIIPEIDSIEESIEEEEEENIIIENDFDFDEEPNELIEITDNGIEELQPEVEEIADIQQTDTTVTQSTDESAEEKNNFEQPEPEKRIPPEIIETGINREVVRKIFFALNKIYSGINITELIKNTRRALKDLINSESADLILIDEKNASMQRTITKDGKAVSEFFQLIDGLTGSCAVLKKTINYDRPTEDSRFNSKIDQPGSASLKRILYFPIINDAGETVAVIQGARENKKFTEDEVSYLTMIGKQLDTAISRTKTLEQLIKEEKLNVSKKLKEVITKEIEVPIEIIDSYTKFLSQKKLPSDTDDIIRMLQKQAASVKEITDSIFKIFSDEATLEKNKIHFNEFIDDVLELLSEYCETRDTKLFKKIGDGALVDIDRSKLYTSIFQIIKACVDDSKKSGKIYFSTELTGDVISITIQNESKGKLSLPEGDVTDYIYNQDKFDLTELGWLIAKKIIVAHTGEVQLESIKGVGSTFKITLPTTRE
jgi:signal transduction histidine kinase